MISRSNKIELKRNNGVTLNTTVKIGRVITVGMGAMLDIIPAALISDTDKQLQNRFICNEFWPCHDTFSTTTILYGLQTMLSVRPC